MTAADTPAGEIIALGRRAMTKLDAIAGCGPTTRPVHLAQLSALLVLAGEQAQRVEANPSAADRDADLWRLREPGFLRAVCDHPLPRPGNVLVLLPVLLTWALLGTAELLYVLDYASADTATRPSFFADWLAQPWYRGPVVLSAVIVVSVVVIMATYRGPATAHRRADETDAVVHRLEVDLLAPITILRARVGPPRVEENARAAATGLADATQRFGLAADRLAASADLVEQLSAAVRRMVDAMPDLRERTEHLAEVDAKLERTSQVISDSIQPLTSVVDDVSTAASAARDAVRTSGDALARASDLAAGAAVVGDQIAEHRRGLGEAQRPFVAAADAVAGAASTLAAGADTLRETADRLKETIREVNWLAMVADGLRHSDHEA